jgi:hypothetical protein
MIGEGLLGSRKLVCRTYVYLNGDEHCSTDSSFCVVFSMLYSSQDYCCEHVSSARSIGGFLRYLPVVLYFSHARRIVF